MAHGVQPLPDGRYAVDLEPEERELLRGLAAELEELVASEDPAVARLFPAAYRDDPKADEEYRRLVRQSLVSGRLEALATLRAARTASLTEAAVLHSRTVNRPITTIKPKPSTIKCLGESGPSKASF